jgi:hypothetical protein
LSHIHVVFALRARVDLHEDSKSDEDLWADWELSLNAASGALSDEALFTPQAI